MGKGGREGRVKTNPNPYFNSSFNSSFFVGFFLLLPPRADGLDAAVGSSGRGRWTNQEARVPLPLWGVPVCMQVENCLCRRLEELRPEAGNQEPLGPVIYGQSMVLLISIPRSRSYVKTLRVAVYWRRTEHDTHTTVTVFNLCATKCSMITDTGLQCSQTRNAEGTQSDEGENKNKNKTKKLLFSSEAACPAEMHLPQPVKQSATAPPWRSWSCSASYRSVPGQIHSAQPPVPQRQSRPVSFKLNSFVKQRGTEYVRGAAAAAAAPGQARAEAVAVIDSFRGNRQSVTVSLPPVTIVSLFFSDSA